VANYDAVIALAKAKRLEHSVSTSSLNIAAIRRIYKAEGVKIDKWKFGWKIRAVYMFDDGDASVAIKDGMPREPTLFSLAHELKHHFLDRELIQDGSLKCGDYNANEAVEIAAEVFAAEFIYPEEEFVACVTGMGILLGKCTPEDVVRLKRTCGALVSYQFLSKRLMRLGFATPETLAKIQFQKLEEKMFGVPFHKSPFFRARRKAKLGK
jgi:Zn-dependent peptidase ImmA (M78 family)